MIGIAVIAERGLTALTNDPLKISYDRADAMIRRPEINCESIDVKDERGGCERQTKTTHIGVGGCTTELQRGTTVVEPLFNTSQTPLAH